MCDTGRVCNGMGVIRDGRIRDGCDGCGRG